MSSKRSRIEIYLDILQTIRKGVDKPTRIMYRTNLSWTVAKEIGAVKKPWYVFNKEMEERFLSIKVDNEL